MCKIQWGFYFSTLDQHWIPTNQMMLYYVKEHTRYKNVSKATCIRNNQYSMKNKLRFHNYVDQSLMLFQYLKLSSFSHQKLLMEACDYIQMCFSLFEERLWKSEWQLNIILEFNTSVWVPYYHTVQQKHIYIWVITVISFLFCRFCERDRHVFLTRSRLNNILSHTGNFLVWSSARKS